MTSPEITEQSEASMEVSSKIEAKPYQPAETGVEQKDYSYLLEKPDMTDKDKEGMQKSIDLLINKKMDTSENLKKLDSIVYAKEYIEIGGVKRARKDMIAKPNGKNIFQYGDTSYFIRSEDMIKEQNKILAQQGMEIPLDSYFEKSLKALPGNYIKGDWYIGGYILALLTDMSIDGMYSLDGRVRWEGEYGYRRSASSVSGDDINARTFGFNDAGDKGGLYKDGRVSGFPIRPVLK